MEGGRGFTSEDRTAPLFFPGRKFLLMSSFERLESCHLCNVTGFFLLVFIRSCFNTDSWSHFQRSVGAESGATTQLENCPLSTVSLTIPSMCFVNGEY